MRIWNISSLGFFCPRVDVCRDVISGIFWTRNTVMEERKIKKSGCSGLDNFVKCCNFLEKFSECFVRVFSVAL